MAESGGHLHCTRILSILPVHPCQLYNAPVHDNVQRGVCVMEGDNGGPPLTNAVDSEGAAGLGLGHEPEELKVGAH